MSFVIRSDSEHGFLKLPVPFAREFWVAEEAGKALGRIGANISATDSSKGYVGFFETDVEHPEAKKVAQSLLTQAQAWLKANGARTAFGPVNFNTWLPYRLRTDSAHADQFIWEPANPPQYVSYWREDGWNEVERYHSQCMGDLARLAEGTKAAFDRAIAAGFSFRSFDPSQLMEREIPILYKISMAGFKDNFLFEPISLEMFRQLYVGIAAKADLSLSRMVMDSEGKELGFFFVFPDRGADGTAYCVMKSIAMLPEARGHGLSNAIMYASAKAALDRGITKAIAALVRSGAQSESYSRKTSGLWRHEYALYTKELS